MLTNAGFAYPFVNPHFRRRILEVLFDGREEAREDLDAARQELKVWRNEENGKYDFQPARSFGDQYVGTYQNPLYGKIRILFTSNGRLLLDAGEWPSSLGKKKEQDGTEKIVATSPAWLGWPELLRPGAERPGHALVPGRTEKGRV